MTATGSSSSTKTSDWRIQVYTGDGKGKTTAAVGLCIRALGNGFKVAMVQFDKGHHEDEHYGERHILRSLEGMDLFATGCERLSPDGRFRFGVLPEDIQEARRGLDIARDLIEHPRHQLVVLDEIVSGVTYQLLEETDVLDLLDRYERAGRPFELVLTGRRASERLVHRADLVTEMRPIRHYFETGLMARRGIEF